MKATFLLAVGGVLLLITGQSTLAAEAPSITAQPLSQTNYSGATVSLAVTTTGTDPLYYQWQKDSSNLSDGVNISGSGSDTLILSNVTAADTGTYSVTITNSAGTTNSLGAVLMVYTRLVQNGGFEMGDFTGWAQSGNHGGTTVTINDHQYVHSGSYGAQMGPLRSLGYISQSVLTMPGQPYLISLWLDSPDGLAPNEFTVDWSGQTILDAVDVGATGWTNMQFFVNATGTNTLLRFGFQNDPSYFGFDEVSLQPVPSLRATLGPASTLALTWDALAGFRYQVQYRTDLVQGGWANLGSPYFATTNSTGTNFDIIAGGQAQRYYRLGVLP